MLKSFFTLLARIAFAATIILIPFRWRTVLLARPNPPVYKDFTDFLLYSSDITVCALILFWGLSLIAARRKITTGPRIIWIPMLGLLLAGLISCFFSLDFQLSFYNELRLVLLSVLYLYVVNENISQTLVVASISVQVLVQSLVAISQFLGQQSLGLGVFGEHILDSAVSGVSVVHYGTARLLRAYGLAEHPNILGGCLAFSLIILLAVYLHGSKKSRWAITPVFLLGLLALFCTFSRSAWVALIAGSGVLLWVEVSARRWNNIRPLMWLAVMAAVALGPFAWAGRDYIGTRLDFAHAFQGNTMEQWSIVERVLLNDAAIKIFLKNPITGVGLGNSAFAIHTNFPDFIGHFVPPHFALLTVAIETGVLGFVSYTLLLLYPWLYLKKRWVELRTNPQLAVTTSLLLAITLVGFVDIYPWLPASGRLWHWLIWGWWAASSRITNVEIEQN